MRDLLTKHGIPATNIAEAAEFLNSASDATVKAFTDDLRVTLSTADTLTAARFAADAILRGAESVGKVVGYVSKRMLGEPAPRSVPVSTVTQSGIPSVGNSLVTVTPMMSTASAVPVTGKRGRPKSGVYANAVRLLDGVQDNQDRTTMLDCLIAAGINKSSAAVYLWRYNKGIRD